MGENIQKPNVMKSLYPATSYTSPCPLLRCVLLILAMYLLVTPWLYANFEEGEAAYEREDYATALRVLRPLAEQGDARAQNRLGYMYKYGRGVTKSPAEAVKWFRKAAEQGDADAQYALGSMYHRGEGVGKDYAEAMKWFRKVAEQGDATAQYALGFMYANGDGVPKDHSEAVKWFRKAAEQGYATAQYALGAMYANDDGVPKDHGEAVKWFRKAAEQGYATAQYNLGVMYENGYGVRKDYAEAVKWYRKAAEQADVYAQYNLGCMYQNGYGVREDYVAAYVWYTLAIAGGNTSARPNRDIVAKSMTSSQIAEAKRRAHNWKVSKEQTQPPILSIEEITFSEGVLDADETATLSIRIKNVGPGDARNLNVKLSSTSQGLTFPVSTRVPTIPKQGGEKTVNIQVTGTLDLPTATATLDIRLSESQFKLEIPGKGLRFETRQFQNPELVLADAAVLEGAAAVSNNRIDLNEMIDLKFYVQNRGTGAAENVKVTVENNQRGVLWVGVASEKGVQREHPTFRTIDAGKYQLVTYSYLVNSEFTDTELRFDIRATERHGRWGFTGTQTAAINTALTPLGTITELPRENIAPRQRPQIEELPALEIDVRKDIPETSTKNPNAVAVVIGNKDYTNPGVPEIAYAENDALIVKQYLIKTLGYSEENIHYHVNATKGVFEEIFGNRETYKGRLYDYVESDGSSDVFIYYSGHGAPDIESKQPYLVPTDANPSTVEVGGYSLKQLYLNLTEVPYRSATVVIDSCFSGMSASGELIPGAKGYGIPSIEIPLLPPQKSVIFTATDKHQVANGYSDKKHSLFTYFFLKALHRDTDVSGDARLTVDEISAYINKHVPRTSRREYGSSREQTPQVFGNKKLVIVQY